MSGQDIECPRSWKEHWGWKKPGVVEHSFDPRTQEADTGRFLRVQGQPALYIEFQDNQNYLERGRETLSLKKKIKKMEGCLKESLSKSSGELVVTDFQQVCVDTRLLLT